VLFLIYFFPTVTHFSFQVLTVAHAMFIDNMLQHYYNILGGWKKSFPAFLSHCITLVAKMPHPHCFSMWLHLDHVTNYLTVTSHIHFHHTVLYVLSKSYITITVPDVLCHLIPGPRDRYWFATFNFLSERSHRIHWSNYSHLLHVLSEPSCNRLWDSAKRHVFLMASRSSLSGPLSLVPPASLAL
jgi:hypothetical protein